MRLVEGVAPVTHFSINTPINIDWPVGGKGVMLLLNFCVWSFDALFIDGCLKAYNTGGSRVVIR